MKKLILMLMLVLTSLTFAERLTTDGKDNLEKLKGEYIDSFATEITKTPDGWYIGSSARENSKNKIEVLKNGILRVKHYYPKNFNNYSADGILYFAYDTKYQTLVKLDKDLNIKEILISKGSKLTTDGNLNNLLGEWASGMIEVKFVNGKWRYGVYDISEMTWSDATLYKKGVLAAKVFSADGTDTEGTMHYFAYDTKYKTFVRVDKDLNIELSYGREIETPFD